MKEKINFLTRVKISIAKVKNYSLLIKDGLGKAFVYMLILSIFVGSVLGGLQFTVLNKIEKETKKCYSKKISSLKLVIIY